ncbi:putative nicotinate-nucleotide adenylyltransferase [Aedoeadaptatus ivorii]|uniref:bis(5'-nucleosyl)-tetraphosphatase (symmetrical) n=1 Tax=Aedoeadaptatus ivorii TaxID=54006 RepID=A0A3S4YV70_9FIRM|nr:bis(5'-nucleosyl)-tetraphosphatase (symmetrical) YqeK [Peptoniphilus ivorii]VEJ35387.1 putative nicotinate-nucleotide adenylyltransferase [Peptoniphilus ivorii]
MKTPNFKKIESDIGEKRYLHTLRVTKTAEELAEIHGVNGEKVRIAARLHDACKYPDAAAIRDRARALNMKEDDVFKDFPQILHAYVAATWAQKELGITDPEILDAIRYHTTGRADMRPLEEIVFLADYLEPMRNFEGVEALRALAKKDLTQAMAASVAQNLKYLLEKRIPVHLDTVRCYNYYIGQIGGGR